MSDLYVNGSSYATGWNEEYKDLKFVTPAPSYADFLAELLGSDQLYKHCYNGKPPQSSVDQTIEFCNAYKQKHGSLENLKVVIELTTARYRQWQQIKDKNGKDVQPVSFPASDNILELTLYFMRRYMDNDTLQEHGEEIAITDIPESELQKYYDEVKMWYPFEMTSVASRKEIWKFVTDCVMHLSRGIKYFEDNNIDYVFWWVNGRTPGTRKILGGISENLGPRVISNKKFNGTDIVDPDPESFNGHPGRTGHKKIAQGIFDYACEHNYLGTNNG